MTTLNLDVLWRDRGATRGLKGIGDETDRAARRMQQFKVAAGVAALAVGAAVVKFGADSVRAYAEAQSSQLKLQDAFQKFPRLADTNIGALRGLNTELAKKTRFDDDATASGQAVLAQFKLTGQQITQLTPLLQDYAAKTGRDLPQAATLLGKAMLGNGRALKEVGINFKDTGDQGKNFDQIMGGLRSQVGGFAEKEGKTAAGQVEILKNQFGELQEAAGSHLLPILTKVVGGVTDMAVAFGELGPFAKTAITTFALGIPTLALAALGIGKVAAAAKSAKVFLSGMGIAARGATIATAGIGAALGVAALAFGFYAEQNAKAKQQTDDFTQALIASNGAIDDNVRSLAAKALQDKGAFDNAAQLGISLQDVTDAALGNDAAMQRVMAAVDHYAAAVDVADTKTQDQVDAANELADALLPMRKNFDDSKKAAEQYGSATKQASVHTETLEEKAAAARKEIDKIRESMFKAASAALQLQGSEDGVEAAFDDARAAVKENGRELDKHSEKGRKNREALRNAAAASLEYRNRLVEQKRPQDQINRATDQSRKEFIDVAKQMGYTRGQAEKLADRFGLTRRKTDEATRATQKYDAQIRALSNKRINLVANYRATATAAAVEFFKTVPGSQASGFSQLPRRAEGGFVNGKGGPTSDSILARLSNGEFVVRASQARKHAPTLEAINTPGFRFGGEVNVRTPGLSQARNLASSFNSLTLSAASSLFGAGLRTIGRVGQAALDAIRAAMTVGGSGGGWGPILALARSLGMRQASTYAGHHPSAALARDMFPPSQGLASGLWSAARRLGIWYVIYNRHIASMTRPGAGWAPYTRSNPHTDHVHVSIYPSTLSRGGGFTSAGGGSNRAIGHRMMLQRWPESQWPSLDWLWTKESNWRTRARNPSSGAYGIPQSLPASKMRSAGADYLTNPATQIKWGLGYIGTRHGSPSGAKRFHQSHNWYDQGGILPPGGVGVNGTRYNERVLSPAQTKAYDQGGGNTYIINAPNYVGTANDLAKAVLKLAERGQLTRAVHLAAGK